MLRMARPIIDAIRAGDVALAKKLLQTQKYCNIIDCQTSRRDGTALFWAACRGLADIVELLLVHGASVHAKTGYGATPLHSAADANKTNVISLLLGYGADINSTTVSGDTPCHLAAYRGHSQTVQILVEAGADLTLRNRKRHRPVDEAESNGHSKIVHYLSTVSNMFHCTNTNSEIEVSCSFPHQREPLKDCNSSTVNTQEDMMSIPKTHHYHFYHHNAGMTNNITMAPITENDCVTSYRTVNDLSITTNSGQNNAQLNYFNIPLCD